MLTCYFFLDQLITFTSFFSFCHLLLVMQWGGLFICLLLAPTYYKTLGQTFTSGFTYSSATGNLWFDEDKSPLVKQCGKKREKGCFYVGGLSYFCRNCIYWYVCIYLYVWPLKTQTHKLTLVYNTPIKSTHRLSICLWTKTTLHQCFYQCVTCIYVDK